MRGQKVGPVLVSDLLTGVFLKQQLQFAATLTRDITQLFHVLYVLGRALEKLLVMQPKALSHLKRLAFGVAKLLKRVSRRL